MGVARIPHAASAISATENKQIRQGESIRDVETLPSTKEYYKFFADLLIDNEALEIALNDCKARLDQMQQDLSDIDLRVTDTEARLTAGGL